jgi:hypothetical protein
MKANLKVMLRRYSALIYGAGLSLLLLEVFLYLKHVNAPESDLDLIWLIVAVAPLTLALLFGGYLRKYKSLGTEIEISLTKPLGKIHIADDNFLEDLPADQKGLNEYLSSLEEAKRKGIQRLGFVTGRSNYYRRDVIRECLEKFPNLKFIEVHDRKGKFLCLLPAKVFGYKNHFDNESIDRFIVGLEQHKVLEAFPFDAITQTAKEDESLLKSLEKLWSHRDLAFLPVISRREKLMGIISRETLEKRMVDNVIEAYRRV